MKNKSEKETGKGQNLNKYLLTKVKCLVTKTCNNIKYLITKRCQGTRSPSFSPSLSLSLSISLPLSLLSLPPFFSPFLFLSLPLSLTDQSEGERVVCTRKQNVWTCSKCSSFNQSVCQDAWLLHYKHSDLSNVFDRNMLLMTLTSAKCHSLIMNLAESQWPMGGNAKSRCHLGMVKVNK